MSNSSEKISFLSYHEPQLKSGDYTIKVEQEVIQTPNPTKADEHPTAGTLETFTATKQIFVGGERFSIPKNQIYHRFPPEGNVGDHSNDLPSIMLNRSTLPWERFAQEESGALTVPWLYLFVFDDDDIQSGNVKVSTADTGTVIDFFQPGTAPPDNPPMIVLEEEPGEKTSSGDYNPAKVNVVQVNTSWATNNKIFPDTNELELLTGVRVNSDVTTDSAHPDTPVFPADAIEMSICIANRLPKQGVKSYAHLLSLENRIDSHGDIDTSKQGMNGDFISFISLTDWSFTCTKEGKESFTELLTNLGQSDFRFPPLNPNVPGASVAEDYLSRGAVALPHHLKEGGQSISWYHGPLMGGSRSADAKLPTLPVRRSDDLLLLDDNLNMLNTSYASAWELGRMLTINNKSMSMDIYAWKRQQAWIDKQNPADKIFHNMQSAAQKEAQTTSMAKQQAKIQQWFESLNLLDNIPFNYLVPDETLIPAESIRFFQLNSFWLSCLLDGAFSIGRVTESDSALESAFGALSQYTGKTISGFLLRSQVVSDWPGLMVQGLKKGTPTSGDESPPDVPITTLRMDRLGPGLLLCLFDGEADEFDIHLKPETIHFGFNPPSTPGDTLQKQMQINYQGSKLVSSPTMIPQGKSSITVGPITTPIVYKSPDTPNPDGNGTINCRVVYMSQMKTNIQNAINSFNTTANKTLPAGTTPFDINLQMNDAQFAMQMVKGVPRVYFKKGSPPALQSFESGNETGEAVKNLYVGNRGSGNKGDLKMTLNDGGSDEQEKQKGFLENLGEGAEEGLKAIEEKLEGHDNTPASIEELQNTSNMGQDKTRTSDLDKVIEKLEGEFPKLSDDLKDFLKHKKEAEEGLHLKGTGLKHDIQKTINDIKNLEPEVTDEVKEKLQEIEQKIESSPLLNMNSAKVRKAWVIVTLVLLVVSTVFWTVTTIIDRERPKPLVFHFQGVKEMQEIEFVKQDYEELVPVATKDGELEFLLTVPATISGKMDMTMMEYEVEGDSVLKVTLPNPIISDPVLNLAEVKDYYDRGGGDKLFLSGGGASYTKAYEQIISSMDETKKGILANAVKDDIIEETNKKARAYLINMAGSIGYRIEFVLKEPDPSWEDDMKKRLGKTYDKVKHKIEGHTGVLKRIKDDLTRKKSDDKKPESK